MRTDLIHIAFSIYDKTGDYSRHTGVTILSILKNTKSQVKIHILHDDTMTLSNKEKFKRLVQSFSQEIEFHAVMLPNDIDKFSGIKNLTLGSLFRLSIAEKLIGIPKVIYLDSDIIVNLDIQLLWNEDISKHAIGAVLYKDVEGTLCQDNNIKMLPFAIENYFNAGVLYLNLNIIKSRYNMRQECLAFLYKYPDAKSLDEAALNYVFQKDNIFLPSKYNYFPYSVKHLCNEKKEVSEYIYHFLSTQKPWRIRRSSFGRLYWEYLSQTPWGEKATDFWGYYEQSLGVIEEDLLNGYICSRKAFLINFIQRLLKEIKLKMRGK